MPSKTKQKQSQKQEQNVKVIINQDSKKKTKKRTTRKQSSNSKGPERYLTPEQAMRMQQTYAPPQISYNTSFPNSDILNLLRSNLSTNGGVLPVINDVRKSLNPSARDSLEQIKAVNRESEIARDMYTGSVAPESYIPRRTIFEDQPQSVKKPVEKRLPMFNEWTEKEFDPSSYSSPAMPQPVQSDSLLGSAASLPQRQYVYENELAEATFNEPQSLAGGQTIVESPVPPPVEMSSKPNPWVFNTVKPQDIAPDILYDSDLTQVNLNPPPSARASKEIVPAGSPSREVTETLSRQIVPYQSPDRELVPVETGVKKGFLNMVKTGLSNVRDALTPKSNKKNQREQGTPMSALKESIAPPPEYTLSASLVFDESDLLSRLPPMPLVPYGSTIAPPPAGFIEPQSQRLRNSLSPAQQSTAQPVQQSPGKRNTFQLSVIPPQLPQGAEQSETAPPKKRGRPSNAELAARAAAEAAQAAGAAGKTSNKGRKSDIAIETLIPRFTLQNRGDRRTRAVQQAEVRGLYQM